MCSKFKFKLIDLSGKNIFLFENKKKYYESIKLILSAFFDKCNIFHGETGFDDEWLMNLISILCHTECFSKNNFKHFCSSITKWNISQELWRYDSFETVLKLWHFLFNLLNWISLRRFGFIEINITKENITLDIEISWFHN